jgi:hypothetical protein
MTDQERLRYAFEQAPSFFNLPTTIRSRRVGRGYRIDSGTEYKHPVTGRTIKQAKGALGVEQRSVHAALHDQRKQSPPEHEPVEAVQNGPDGGAEPRYEFLYDGVFLEVAGLGRTTQVLREAAPSLLWVAGVSPS